MTIEFNIQTAREDEAPKGTPITIGMNVVFHNVLEIMWRLAQLGAEKPEVEFTGWRTARVSFQTEDGALAFKLLCEREIFLKCIFSMNGAIY